MNQIGVLLVDDHTLLRSGLKLLIESQPDIKVVGEAGTLQQAIEVAPSARPDVITLDLSMPGGSGITGVRRLLDASPAAKVLVLTMHDDPAYVRSAIAMGAAGYLVKSTADSELISAIRTVAKGGVFIDVHSTGSLQSVLSTAKPGERGATPIESLSVREREVLAEVAKGYTSQQIADRAGLSVKTVDSYRARLMQKLGLKDRADLMRIAVSAGLLNESEGR
ncbi:MAG: response regulator transcription factor [Phycisphaeraceae bacterium]|nr:response regulator transcription factor [Phycisphaeraceae bacterium]